MVAAGVVPLVSASAVSSQAAAKYQVGMKISTTQAVADEDTVTLTGKVSPAAPGTKVKVQVLWEGRKTWKDAGSAKVKKDSTYKFSILPSTHLDRAYRVVKPGDDDSNDRYQQGAGPAGAQVGVAEQHDAQRHEGRQHHQRDADQR